MEAEWNFGNFKINGEENMSKFDKFLIWIIVQQHTITSSSLLYE